jgi:hypothetical protein
MFLQILCSVALRGKGCQSGDAPNPRLSPPLMDTQSKIRSPLADSAMAYCMIFCHDRH